jgi:hypothetical protein
MRVPKKQIQNAEKVLNRYPSTERAFVTWDTDFHEFTTDIPTLHHTISDDGYITAVIVDRDGAVYLQPFTEDK